MLTLIVAFIAITFRSEMRRGSPEGDYGRLYRRELPPPPAVEQRPVEVVEEANPIDDQVSADPMLVAPAARSQWLEADAVPVTTTRTVRDGRSRVAIVGGPEGVAMIDNAPQRETKKLKGGIFRTN